MSEPALPGMPDTPPAAKTKPKPGMRVTRSSPRNRQLCEDCCELIHLLGMAFAPYPKAARWTLASERWTKRLCDEHKEELLR